MGTLGPAAGAAPAVSAQRTSSAGPRAHAADRPHAPHSAHATHAAGIAALRSHLDLHATQHHSTSSYADTRLAGLFSCAYHTRDTTPHRAPTPRAPAHRGGGTSRIHCLVTHISHPRSVCHTRSPRSLSHYAARWSAEGGTARPPSNIRSTAAPRAHDVHAATAHSVLAARPPVLPLTRSAAPPRRTVIFAGSATAPAACHTPSHRSAACAAGNK